MSKKIWRGYSFMPASIDRTRECHHAGANISNATVVEDELCFPVREAMAFIKKAEKLGRGWFHVSEGSVAAEEWNAMGDAFDKYLAAVERMKKKAKVKK